MVVGGSILLGNDPDLSESSDLLERLEREGADYYPSSSSVVPSSAEVVSEDVFYGESATFDDVCSVCHFELRLFCLGYVFIVYHQIGYV